MSATYLNLNVHAIFATRDRAPMIAEEWRGELHAYIGGVLRTLNVRPLIIGGVADHVHVLMGIKATHAVADVIREMKKVSSQWGAERYERFGWQTGYAAISVGPSELPRVTAYIARQDEHHRKLTSSEELRILLVEAGIEIDERYFE